MFNQDVNFDEVVDPDEFSLSIAQIDRQIAIQIANEEGLSFEDVSLTSDGLTIQGEQLVGVQDFDAGQFADLDLDAEAKEAISETDQATAA